MIGQTISHYKILEKLGEGGMGVVYKAEDTKLDRLLALKFLAHHLTRPNDAVGQAASEAEQARFLQEAKAASALNHPNVCTIYDIKEEGGQLFIVMEYVEGVTIRQKLPVMKLNDVLSYAIQIGEALNEAHSKGIVHRDVKAENIMVNSKNQVKVMDFGLAKLKGTLKLIRTSSTVGTLAYMAPEQIQGGEVDGRSDIFSFGIVFFEMLTGKTPFRGEHEASMMYSILNEEPDSALKLRPDLSPELDRIIRRALEKDPQDRYQHVDDMVSELRRVQKSRPSGGTRVSRASLSEINVPASVETSSAKPMETPAQKGNRTLVIGGVLLGGIIIAVIGYFFFVGRPAGEEKRVDSIAVLPFGNVGADPNTEYISDGITENIINNLTRLQKLRVIPRSTVFHYKGKELDPQKIGGELHVSVVLTGRVVQRGDNLNIQTDLIDVQQQSQLWGKQYQQKLTDLLGVQDEISKDVAAELKLQLSGEEQKNLTKRGTDNPEAYELYLKGRYYWNKRKADDIKTGIQYFQEAIDKDPTYALAYAGLADCYCVLPQYAGLPSSEILPKARTAAQKALEIDHTLAEPHTSLAEVYEELDWNFSSAETEFKRSIELNPNYPTAHHWYAITLAHLGRYDEAIKESEKAYQLDPLSLIISNLRGVAYYWAGKYDEAIAALRSTLELDSTFNTAHISLGNALVQKNKYAEAIDEFEKAVALSKRRIEALGALGYAYAHAARREEALKLLEELKQLIPQGYDPSLHIALIYAGLGDDDAAFQWLDKAYEIRSGYIVELKLYRQFDRLHSNPRFIALLKKIGLER